MRALLGILLALGFTSSAEAQYRELHWSLIEVTAHVDADGRLHVREQQDMVFSGAWNGGERTFSVPAGQELVLERMERVGQAGSAIRMVEGDLDRVDHYGWTDNHTLRWRSRKPEDPPFAETQLRYVLHLVYSKVLQAEEDARFVLDHDFAFATRTGDIERFRLVLTVDPAWQPLQEIPRIYEAGPLIPGQGYVVTIPLRHVGSGLPAAVRLGAAAGIRYALAALLVVGGVAFFLAFLRHQKARGLWLPEPAPEPETMTKDYLDRCIFAYPPEVIGAAWDRKTAAPEVAATIARLVQEGKLESAVETRRGLLFKRTILKLTLKQPRKAFEGYEKSLINALFSGESDVTDTDQIRERYRKSGFDPAARIQKRVQSLVAREFPDEEPAQASWHLTGVLACVGVGLGAASALHDELDVLVALLAAFVALMIYGLALPQAHLVRARVEGARKHALRYLLPLCVLAGAWLWMLVENPTRCDTLALSGLTLFSLALVRSVFNQARCRESAAGVAKRRELARVRTYLRDQLRSERPQLADACVPYLIAFGLGRHLDRWFDAFGGESTAQHLHRSHGVGSSPTSAPSTEPGAFTGGGGKFGGGGASGSFAAAITTLSSGVAAPSSSSGGGGGGGSSGGGGGGGW